MLYVCDKKVYIEFTLVHEIVQLRSFPVLELELAVVGFFGLGFGLSSSLREAAIARARASSSSVEGGGAVLWGCEECGW
jgi:hypothetical protein